MPDKEYFCPACDTEDPMILDHDNVFKCYFCGGEIAIEGYKPPKQPYKKPPYVENTACLVCGIKEETFKVPYDADGYGTQKNNGYFCSPCLALWNEQINQDRLQIDMEIKVHEKMPEIPCPFCKEADVITLQPWQHERALWQCNHCEMVIGENYIYGKIRELGLEIPRCPRCGRGFSLAMGHDCLVQRIHLRR